MSPARSKNRGRSTGAASRRQPQKLRKYERSDIVKAVLVSATLVVVTAIIVWMLRPGPAGIPATGGIMNRQPRASWLIVGAVAAGSIACWVILRRGASKRARRRAKVILPIALVIVLLGTIGLAIAWPGGLLRHDVAPVAEPEPEPEPTTPPTTPSTPSTKPTGTTGTTGTSGTTGTTGPPTTPPR